MKKQNLRIAALLFAAAAIFVGCKKEDPSINSYLDASSPLSYTVSELHHSSCSTKDGSDTDKIELGKDLGIPFSLRNMQAAADYINSLSTSKHISIQPTHYYIQFNPSTNSHLVILDSLCNIYALFNYPIQNEVVTEGSHLSTSKDTQNKFDPLYGSIPVGDILPDVPYRIVDTLYDPDVDNLDLTIVSYVLTGNADQLGIKYNGEDLTEEDLADYLSLPQATRSSSDYYPEGIVKVYDPNRHSYMPVSNIKLQIVRFGIPYNVSTDDNGYFKLQKSMRGEVKVRATWRNDDYTIRKSWNEMLGICTSDALGYLNKNTSGPNHEITIEQTDSHLWYKAVVNNSLYKYNHQMELSGITGIHNNANIWVVTMNTGSGAATPMAKKYTWAVTSSSLLSGWLACFMPVSYPIVTQFNLLFRNLYPDIVITISNANMNICSIDKLVFHECGHFSHGVKTGGAFWGNFVNCEFVNIINNSDHDPYQNGVTPSVADGKLIALCEGWADFCCYLNMHHYYPSSYTNYIENFTMRTVPSVSCVNIFNPDKNFWTLSGLFWDIVDNSSEVNSTRVNGMTGAFINNIVDYLQIGNISNIYPIYNKMTNTTSSGEDLKAKLLTSYPTKQAQINQLFGSYGY